MKALMTMVALALALASGNLIDTKEQREERMKRLNASTMGSVATWEGFEYFSGYLDTGEHPQQFLTLYSFSNEGVPSVRLVGHGVNKTYTLAEIEKALADFKVLVMAKYTLR